MEYGKQQLWPEEAAEVPDELRERPVRMVLEIRRETGTSHGVIARVARELGVGAQSLSGWVSRAEVTRGTGQGRRPLMRSGWLSW